MNIIKYITSSGDTDQIFASFFEKFLDNCIDSIEFLWELTIVLKNVVQSHQATYECVENHKKYFQIL